jgi:hypothetical protein
MSHRLRLSVLARGALLSAVAAAAWAAAGQAGPPGTWTQITKAHNGAKANLGLARDKDGTLHVLWAGPAGRPFTAIFDTPISPAGAVGQPKPIVSGWASVNPPAAIAAPDGTIHGVISGHKTNSNQDPTSGLNDAIGPGGWQIGGNAFGNTSITVASNADVGTGLLKTGQLVSVWETAARLLLQSGVDPGTAPQDITPPGDLGANPVLAVDQASGAAIVAYHGANSGGDFFRQVLPDLGAPQAFPQAKFDGPAIAARAGGGVYTAYTPDGAKVVLLRYGGAPKAVPVPKGARVLVAGVSAGPEGRLWVYYGNEQTTYVTRTNKAASSYEPVQALKSPKAVQYFRLEGEGSAGPLDLFADVTVDGGTKDGSYHQQVRPLLSLSLSKHAVKNKQGKVTGTKVTARVTDAGDPVPGASVSGLAGGVKATDAKGQVTVTAPAGKHGSVGATKPGYVSAKSGSY